MDYIQSFGAIPSPKDIRDYKGVCAAPASSFPDEFELSMPKVKNQGSIGSCVAHSIAVTMEYFCRLQGDSTEDISVGFIYGNRAESHYDGVGMIVSEALNRVSKCGSVTTSKFNIHKEVPAIQKAVSSRIIELLPEAYPNHITSYFRLNNDDAIKACLMENGPVVFAMKWFDDIKVVNGIIKTEAKVSDSSHAMVIYGWNKDGWKIQNSWGTGWGKSGRAILPFNVPRSETWGIIDTYSENQHKLKEDELISRIDELTHSLTLKTFEIDELQEKLNKALDVNDSNISDIQQEYNKLVKLYEEQEKELSRYEEEIKSLNKKLIEIKKPFNSSLGDIIAKIINFIIKNLVKK